MTLSNKKQLEGKKKLKTFSISTHKKQEAKNK